MNGNANYKTLGLSPDASWDDVKSAFRRLARTYHPDVAGPEGSRRFTEITEAYMTLKDTISPGAVRKGAVSRRQPRAAARTVTDVEKGESLLKIFWRKLTSFRLFPARERASGYSSETSDNIPPARVRFIGSIISRAESEIYGILSRRVEIVERNRTEAILRRLRSRHPGVVLLALKRISIKDASDEMRRAIVDHFKITAPAPEVMEGVLALFFATPSALDLARALSKHSNSYSKSDSIMLLRWYRRNAATKDCYAPFLSHSSSDVVAAALDNWPSGEGLPEMAEIMNIFKKDDETTLIPLLRLLKKEKLPIWVLQIADRIKREHKSAVVRVWASAIVRDRNLG